MKFFTPTGKGITPEQFIRFYSECYYLDNNPIVEEAIEEILKNGFRKKEDVISVLAWKMGKLYQKTASITKDDPFHYHKRFFDAEKFQVSFYNNVPVDLSGFSERILQMNGKDDLSPQEILNELSSAAQKGIGTVYLIAFLFFLSHGKYPIYDRFADIAITAALEEKKPASSVIFSPLPDKNDPAFGSLCATDGRYNKYIVKLNKAFGKDYISNRKIDQALWVYGHLFYSSSK